MTVKKNTPNIDKLSEDGVRQNWRYQMLRESMHLRFDPKQKNKY